jgi:hypothetical protein
MNERPMCALCEAVVDAPSDQPYVAITHKRQDAMMIVATSHDQQLSTPHEQLVFDHACSTLLPTANGLFYWNFDDLKKFKGVNQHIRAIYRKKPVYQQMPQKLADAITKEADLACAWFFDPNFVYTDFMSVPTRSPILDAEVHDRIQGFQYGMDREIARLHHFEFIQGWAWRFDDNWRDMHSAWVENYKTNHEPVCEHNDPLAPSAHLRLDLTELPWIIRRALATRWQRLWESYTTEPEKWLT